MNFLNKFGEWGSGVVLWWDRACEFCIKVRYFAWWLGWLGVLLLVHHFIFNQPPLSVSGGLSLTPQIGNDRIYSAAWFIDYKGWCNLCDFKVTRYISGCGLHIINETIPAKPEQKVTVKIPDYIPQGSVCAYQTQVEYSCNFLERLFPGHIDFPPLLFAVKIQPINNNNENPAP